MSMLGKTRVAGRIDDDMLRRIMHAIEEACRALVPESLREQSIEIAVDGDLFLAYQRVRQLFAEAYPDLYGGGADD